ncbi:MAG: hypothetical protein KAJ64_00370 [Thermoplasmata archaeon]|nr:hypothetical protein [Thermoplasmata archaeon]
MAMTLYPWRGEFTVGSIDSQIAIDTLSSSFNFKAAFRAHLCFQSGF